MLLFWRIRYLDKRDKQFKDRDLWLDTDTLEPVTKAAVEAIIDLEDPGRQRDMLSYRHLFREQKYSGAELNELCTRHASMKSVSIYGYSEDENGKELTNKQLAVILTGNPDAVMFPAGAKQHDVDYAIADKPPIALSQISLSDEQVILLGYFTRDLREMLDSGFLKDGPGTLTGSVGKDPILQTAVSDEEIRSFVMIFRRLYMQNEDFNFVKAAKVAAEVLGAHPLGKWIQGAAHEYEATLADKPILVPFLQGGKCPFSRKRVIDVFLYTRYAHQPDVRRIRQFQEYLQAVGNRRGVLTWLFLVSLWECSLCITNAGRTIGAFYDRYCKQHGATPDILDSVLSESPGIGALEKKHARIERILNEKADELAHAIWMARGCPPGGPSQFLAKAREQLRATLE